MRVGIAGLLHESNTFLPRPTEYEDFASTSLTKGGDLIERWRNTRHELGGFLEGAREFGFDVAPALASFAVPGGALTPQAFERLSGEFLNAIDSAAPIDGMLLALQAPPMLIRISSQYTAEQPAKGLYDDLREALAWPGILSASVMMGFYYADVEEMGASFLAVAEGDPALARRAAKWMARRAWDRRREFATRLPTAGGAVRPAPPTTPTPPVLLDVGDNVRGRNPGDFTAL